MQLSRRSLLKAGIVVVGGGILLQSVLTDSDTGDEKSGMRDPNNGGQSRSLPGNVSIQRSNVFYVSPDENIEGIQRVIDTYAPNATIVLDRGTYLGSRLTLRNDVQLLGVAPGMTTLKLADGSNTDLVVSPNPDQQVSMRIQMDNLTLDGNKQHNSSGDLVYGAFWNSRFTNCEFVDSPGDGFWLAGSSSGSTDDNVFRNCRFARCEGNGMRLGANRERGASVGVTRIVTCWYGRNKGHGIQIRGNGNFVTNAKFYQNRGSDILLDRGNRNIISENDLSKASPSAPCISVWSHKGVNSSNNQITGNVIFGSFPDAVFCHADENDIRALQIHDNVISGDGTGNQSAIKAIGEQFIACSARNNTITGDFAGSKIQVPSTWATSGNIT